MSQSMNYKIALLAGLAALLVASVPAFTQQIPPQMNPTPGCASTPAQLEATKKAALDFAFLTGDAKIARVIIPSCRMRAEFAASPSATAPAISVV